MPTRLINAILLLLSSLSAGATQVNVAVASNFTPTLRELVSIFETESGHRLRISSASTGKLYAQIIHGAPFDILLAADAERPKRLERSGKTVPGSRFTYATGKLVLWGPTLNSDNSATQLLQSSQIRSIAMANPLTAPYGSATRHSLQKMDLWNSLQDRLVRGENIGQSYQYVVSGAAQIGFVAYSQVLRRKHDTGYLWQVPASHHPPIRQQAVLLKRAENNPAALTFLDYLRSPQVQRRISEQGYDIE